MAAGAGAGAVLIGWLITGVGMLALALVYQSLAMRKPDLNNGVYAYARATAGEYVGFNAAWGYWVSAWIGNVGYLVAAFGALGYFFPVFGDGNTAAAVAGASVVLWVVHALVLRGIQGAAMFKSVRARSPALTRRSTSAASATASSRRRTAALRSASVERACQ